MLVYLMVCSLLITFGTAAKICPEGYTMGSFGGCYKLFGTIASWYDASTTCGNHVDGGALAVPINNDVLAELKDFIELPNEPWIGVRYMDASSMWLDEKDEIVPPTWAPTYPKSVTAGQCVHLMDGLWQDDSCDNTKPYVCQVQAIDVICENNWTMLPDVARCLKVIKKQRKTFSQASDYCKDLSGDLATTVAMRHHRHAVMDGTNFRAHFWIGVHDSNQGGTFSYINGDSLGDNPPFRKGRPTGSRHCVSMRMKRWYDKRCNRRHFFICEKAATQA